MTHLSAAVLAFSVPSPSLLIGAALAASVALASTRADTTVLGFVGHVIAGTVWSIFHILIVLLQAFIFMMLTLVYIGQAHDSH